MYYEVSLTHKIKTGRRFKIESDAELQKLYKHLVDSEWSINVCVFEFEDAATIIEEIDL